MRYTVRSPTSPRLSSPALPHTAQEVAGAHILIVDDRPDELQLLIEILRASRCRISVAFDGAQAYNRAQLIAPDLILMDVRMPRMDGFTACRLLAANPATQAIPILILTAADKLDDRIHGLELGAMDYILKPFEPAEVIARIRNHLRKIIRRRLDEHLPDLPEGPDAALVRAAVAVLLRDLRHAPTVEELARLVGTHEKRLSRAFRDNLGQTVGEYIRDTRLKMAQRFLLDTSMSVSDIAEEIGFSTAGNFATAFRDRFAMTPSDWRRRKGRIEDDHPPAELQADA
ncbi:response regulator [Massilia cellulosiltytica]|uniref:response regulator transcription factor n=1 Tax=Massilia cellulosiltytica TaxID=2683234 RepID=UPI0039B3F924